MFPSNFRHQLFFFKKNFIHGGFIQNNLLSLRPNWQRNAKCLFCSTAAVRNKTAFMKAWRAQHRGLQNLSLSSAEFPLISKPNDVLVKVSAASVNPLDILMINENYGSSSFDFLYSFSKYGDVLEQPSFPLTGGRDFVGEVVRVGHSVSDIQINDKVWGVVMPQNQGSHAEYVVTSDYLVSQKPENISDVEAASIPYVGLTSWSTAVFAGELQPEDCEGLQIGLLGASGGVGTFLTQLLSLWGAKVTGICSKDSFELVEKCGAFEVYDYRDPKTLEKLIKEEKFHMVIDAGGVNDLDTWADTLRYSDRPTVISLKSPLLVNIDEKGLISGALKTLGELIKLNTLYTPGGAIFKWSFFFPDKKALQYIGKLVKEEKIRPIIDKVYKMEDLASAYKHVKDGPKQGKIVIDFTS